MNINTNITTYTYTYDDEYLVDIVVNTAAGEYDAWLYKWNYAHKLYMFGGFMSYVTLDDFIKTVERNVDDYIQNYEDEVNYYE